MDNPLNNLQACFTMPRWFREDHVNAVNDILSYLEMDFRVDTLSSKEEQALNEAVRNTMTMDQFEFFSQYRYHASKMVWMKYRVFEKEARLHTTLLCDFDSGLIFPAPRPPEPPRTIHIPIKHNPT